MPLWKRKPETEIPPVAPATNPYTNPQPGRSQYSNSSTYNSSRDGDPYNNYPPSYHTNASSATRVDDYSQQQYDNYGDKYSRNKPVGDQYSRGNAQIDQDRNELFAGYNPKKAGSGRFFDGPDPGKEPTPGEENEEDVEGIKKQTRWMKQESVNSTRNALRMAREAEETARNTLLKLGDQSEKLANTERHLDVAKGHSQRAADNADELKQLNRSIFRPVITFNKDAKRAAAEAKVQARFEEERQEREKTMVDIRETQTRLGRATTYGRDDDEEGLAGGGARARFKSQETLASRKEQRKRYQFEATASDDEIEDELDDNLGEIGEATRRLKALGMAMGSELDAQNGRLNTLEQKTVRVDQKLALNTERLKRIK